VKIKTVKKDFGQGRIMGGRVDRKWAGMGGTRKKRKRSNAEMKTAAWVRREPEVRKKTSQKRGIPWGGGQRSGERGSGGGWERCSVHRTVFQNRGVKDQFGTLYDARTQGKGGTGRRVAVDKGKKIAFWRRQRWAGSGGKKRAREGGVSC